MGSALDPRLCGRSTAARLAAREENETVPGLEETRSVHAAARRSTATHQLPPFLAHMHFLRLEASMQSAIRSQRSPASKTSQLLRFQRLTESLDSEARKHALHNLVGVSSRLFWPLTDKTESTESPTQPRARRRKYRSLLVDLSVRTSRSAGNCQELALRHVECRRIRTVSYSKAMDGSNHGSESGFSHACRRDRPATAVRSLVLHGGHLTSPTLESSAYASHLSVRSRII